MRNLSNVVRFGAMALLGASLLTSAAARKPHPAPGDRWEKWADGLERANQVIERCLATAGATPELLPQPCIRAAYTVCEREHGTSQRAMNECAAMSHGAWDARIAETMARLARAKSADTRLGAQTDEAKHQLIESQQRWIDWVAADCQLQAKGTEGGSIRPFTISICLSDRAAVRANDLQRLIESWLG